MTFFLQRMLIYKKSCILWKKTRLQNIITARNFSVQSRRKISNLFNFPTWRFSSIVVGMDITTWRRSRCSKDCFTHSKESFYQKLVKILISDKRQSHIRYTLSTCLMKTDSKLTEKVVCWSTLLNIWTLNLIFSYEKYKFNQV